MGCEFFFHFDDIFSLRLFMHSDKYEFLQVTLPKYTGGIKCWSPDRNFSIDRHVFQGPDFTNTKEDLQNFIGKLQQQGLQNDKPLWEFHLVSPNKHQNNTVIIVR